MRSYILLYVVYRCDQGTVDIVATTDISIDQANVTKLYAKLDIDIISYKIM